MGGITLTVKIKFHKVTLRKTSVDEADYCAAVKPSNQLRQVSNIHRSIDNIRGNFGHAGVLL